MKRAGGGIEVILRATAEEDPALFGKLLQRVGSAIEGKKEQ